MATPALPEKTAFTPEQRQVLGEIYRFLKMRRRERLTRLAEEQASQLRVDAPVLPMHTKHKQARADYQ